MTFQVLTVGIDLNNTIVDTRAGLLSHSRRLSGLNITPGQFVGRETVGRQFPTTQDGSKFAVFTAEQYERAKDLYFNTPVGFLEHALPCAGAVKLLQVLCAQGHSLQLVTDAASLQEKVVRDWWRRVGLPSTCEFHFTRGASKDELYALCHVIVDDDLKHLLPHVENPDMRLYHALPAPGAVGCDVVKRPDGLSDRIISVQGCEPLLADWRNWQAELAAAQTVAA
jgi:hypothetical protein